MLHHQLSCLDQRLLGLVLGTLVDETVIRAGLGHWKRNIYGGGEDRSTLFVTAICGIRQSGVLGAGVRQPPEESVQRLGPRSIPEIRLFLGGCCIGASG